MIKIFSLIDRVALERDLFYEREDSDFNFVDTAALLAKALRVAVDSLNEIKSEKNIFDGSHSWAAYEASDAIDRISKMVKNDYT